MGQVLTQSDVSILEHLVQIVMISTMARTAIPKVNHAKLQQATCAILTIGTIWYRILSLTLLILHIINLGHFHCYKVYTSENKLHSRILSGLSYIILIRQCHSEIKRAIIYNLVSINHCPV